jgi:hypothetical protein
MLPASAVVIDSARSNVKLVVKEDQELDGKCEIQDCINDAEFRCEQKAGCCSFGWKSCGRKLCREHSHPEHRCKSDP